MKGGNKARKTVPRGQVNARFEPHILERLEEIAEIETRTMANVVERLVLEALSARAERAAGAAYVGPG